MGQTARVSNKGIIAVGCVRRRWRGRRSPSATRYLEVCLTSPVGLW